MYTGGLLGATGVHWGTIGDHRCTGGLLGAIGVHWGTIGDHRCTFGAYWGPEVYNGGP